MARHEQADVFERALAIWQPRTSRQLCAEDARQINENLTGFFGLLARWQARIDAEDDDPSATLNQAAGQSGHE